jgi:hypothetical protein
MDSQGVRPLGRPLLFRRLAVTDVIVDELAEDLEAALGEFATIASDLQERGEP